MTEEADTFRQFARARAEQLQDEDITLRRWLVRNRILGWPLHICAITLPVLAGAQALAAKINPVMVAIIAFAGAAANALHTGLGCEAYQQALKDTTQRTREVMESFEAALAMPDRDLEEFVKSAEASLKQLREKSRDIPPKRRRDLLSQITAIFPALNREAEKSTDLNR